MEDRGIYVCRAENSAGMNQDWSIVEVESKYSVAYKVYIAVYYANTHPPLQREGGTLLCTCLFVSPSVGLSYTTLSNQ